jgi:hypothetical protein
MLDSTILLKERDVSENKYNECMLKSFLYKKIKRRTIKARHMLTSLYFVEEQRSKTKKKSTCAICVPSHSFHLFLIGKNSQLSMANKLIIYKIILKPIWTYGIELWGCSKPSNTKVLQTFQSKMLRSITKAPWFVSN